MNYIFAFDTSSEAIISEFLQSSCENLKSILFGSADAEGDQLPPALSALSRVAILSFDTTLHFYDLSVRCLLLSFGYLNLIFLSQTPPQCWS